MTELLMSLTLAYVFILTLLVISIVYSSIHNVLKTGLVLIVVCFFWVSYQGWKEAQGWPSQTRLPDNFLLHFAVIEEPDKELDIDGQIFVWLTEVSDFETQGNPRSYRISYDQQTHTKLSEAMKEMQRGNLQLGEIKSPKELKESERQSSVAGQEYPGLTFTKLPDPALPEK